VRAGTNESLSAASPVATALSACRSTSTPATPPVSPDTWAVVNGRPITRGEVDKAYERNRDASQTLSTEETLAAKMGVLDDLITQLRRA